MGRSPETGAAMVAGADRRLAEAAVPNRPGHAALTRNDLSQPVRLDARRLEERADGAFTERRKHFHWHSIMRMRHPRAATTLLMKHGGRL
jgi:hypothetical protein